MFRPGTRVKASIEPSELATSSGSQARIFYGHWLIGAAFIAQFVAVGVQGYVIGSFLAPMTEELGWTRAEFTIPRSLGGLVMAFTGVLIGAHVDRHGGRGLMLVGTTLLSAALLALSWIETLWQWVVVNGVVMTVGSAMMGNLVVNVTLAKWFVERRGRAIALAAMGVSFAGVVLVPLMTAAIDAFGWRAGWRILALGTAVLIYPVALMMRRAPEDYGLHPDGRSDEDVAAGLAERAALDHATSFTRGEALRTGSFYLLVLAFGLFVVNIGIMLLHTIPFMTDAGYPRATAALMITVASIPALVSKPAWGVLIDKLPPKPLAAGSSLFTGAALMMIVSGVHAGSESWVYAGFFLLGCGWGGSIPLQEVIWASFFGRRYLGAVRSAAIPFSILLGAGAPLAASVYFDWVGNYDGALLTVASLNLFAAALFLVIPRPRRRSS